MSATVNHILSRGPPAECRILICEDDPLIARGWAALLADEGYTVVGPAHSAERALELAYQHLPALTLTDIDLGGTIDGISVATELAPLGIPVIFITANYRKAAVEGREFAADILIKPVRDRTVLHSIASVLQGEQGTDTGRIALCA
jgi:two-component system, response regulator PdtaR